MDHSIKWVANALCAKYPLEKIHDDLKAAGMLEHNIYFAIKAGTILFEARLDLYGETF
jgi:hypothetical protein